MAMKKLFFLSYFLFPNICHAVINSSGPLTPSTAQNTGGGMVAWIVPTNVEVEDGILSTATIGVNITSEFLAGTGFGFQISSQAIVTGIMLEIKKMASATLVVDNSVILYNADGTTTSTDKADTSTGWPSSLNWFQYGSSTDTWGKAWTGADINSAGFGAGVQAKRTNGSGIAELDAYRITVWFYNPVTTINGGTIYGGTFR